MAKLSIIIPAYNEEKTIEKIVNKLIATELIRETQKQLVIVDDHSTDATSDLILKLKASYPNVDIITQRNDKNKGK